MAAITEEDTSSKYSLTTVSRSSSSSSTTASMVSSILSRTSSVSSATTISSDPGPKGAPESPSPDSHEDDGESTSTGKWSFTPYQSAKLCSPTESRFSHSDDEADDECYTTYTVGKGGAAEPDEFDRVGKELSEAKRKVAMAKDKLDQLLQLQHLTETRNFSPGGTDPPAVEEGKLRAEARHWKTLQRYSSAIESGKAELSRYEEEAMQRTAELGLLSLDLSEGSDAKVPASGKWGKYLSDLENGALSLVFGGQELNEPP